MTVRRLLPLAAAACCAAAALPASAHAARVTIGSDLDVPATIAHNEPNDITLWNEALVGGSGVEVPVAGQAIIIRIKGGTVQPRGAAADPLYDIMHFQVYRPQGDGSFRVVGTSPDLKAPVLGKNGATENTVTTYDQLGAMCVQPGDRISLSTVGGFDYEKFPQGLPYQMFGARPGAAIVDVRANGTTGLMDQTVYGPERLTRTDGQELLLQAVIGSASQARYACGGFASRPDPGAAPETQDPVPGSKDDPNRPRPNTTVPAPRAHPKVRRDRSVKLPAFCHGYKGAACSGTITASYKGRVVATRTYSLAPKKTSYFPVKLSRATYAALRKTRRQRITLTVVAAGADGLVDTEKIAVDRDTRYDR